MPLDKNKVPIPLAHGLDTKSDPKQVQPGKLTTLENAVFLKNGEIKKRNGFRYYFPYSSSAAFPKACSTFKDMLFILGTSRAYTYVPGTSLSNSQGNLGPYDSAKITKSVGVASSVNAATAVDTTRNVLFYAYEYTDRSVSPAVTKIGWYFVDIATNARITSSLTGGDLEGRRPKVVTNSFMDYYLIVFEYVNAGAGTIELRSLGLNKNLSGFFYYQPIASGTEYSGYGFALSGTQNPKICWSAGSTGADTKINVLSNSFNTFGTTPPPTPVTITGTSCRYGADICEISDTMFALNDGSNIRTVVYNSGLTAVVNPLRVAMTVGAGESFWGVALDYVTNSSGVSSFIIFTTTLTGTNVTQLPRIQSARVDGTSTLSFKADFILGAAIAGNSFRRTVDSTTRYYLPIKMIQQFNPGLSSGYDGLYTNYMINYSVAGYTAPVTKIASAKFLDLNATSLENLTGFPAYSYFSPGTYLENESTVYGLVATKSGDSSLFTFSDDSRPIMAELGNALFVSGGILRMFDGFNFVEHNFLHTPLQPALNNIATGAILPGTYNYVITYEWRDSYGQEHISAPSTPRPIVLSSSGHTVNVDCATLKITSKNTPVWIGIYRSNDGFLYYKLPNTGIGSTFYSQSTLTTIPYIDNNAQAAILSRPLLYTVGGELDNVCAPACTFVGTYKKRLVLVPSEDTNSFWYSKEIIPTTADTIGAPVDFATEFVQTVGEENGKVTGIGELDDKLIIFKSATIFVMTGSGPASNGLNNDFTTPQALAVDTGCLYGRSIVLTPLGLMFQSPKGFYLLDRSLTASYIGSPIEVYNSSECTSATLIYDRNEIWMALNDGKIIVFNYFFNQFSMLPLENTSASNRNGTIYKGVYVSVSNSTIQIEQPGVYQDTNTGGTNIGYAMKVSTGWMSFADIQGFQRIYKLLLLGDYKSPHRIQVQVAVDFNDTVVQTSTITPDGTLPNQYRIFMTRQKCEAIKFTIQDLAPTSGTWAEAFTLSNMAMEVGVKRGLNKVTAAKSVG